MLPGQEFSDYINASYVDVITTLEGALSTWGWIGVKLGFDP